MVSQQSIQSQISSGGSHGSHSTSTKAQSALHNFMVRLRKTKPNQTTKISQPIRWEKSHSMHLVECFDFYHLFSFSLLLLNCTTHTFIKREELL
jgi:hypothetical protein